MWNRALTADEVSTLHEDYSDDGLSLHYDFEDGLVVDKSDNDNDGINFNCEFNKDDIKIP